MDTRKLERHHFKIFRKLHNDFPQGEVWHEDKPDFWVFTQNSVLGIEHNLIHIPSSSNSVKQAIESQTDDIVSIAREHAELRETPKTQGSILFDINYTTGNKKQRIELGRQISRIVHKNLTESNQPIKPLTEFDIRDNLPESVSLIHLTTVNDDMDTHWHCASAGWAMQDCGQLLQDSISKKAEKIGDYMKSCESCWLLLVADSKPSGFIHPDQKSLLRTYDSPFSKTYMMDLNLRKLHKLNTQKS